MFADEIQKKSLECFWSRFGGWNANSSKLNSSFPREEKLSELVGMASMRLPYKHQQPTATRREKFNKVRARICRDKIGTPCFVCEQPGYNRHHIIQLQNGGLNSRRNLVILCDDCHELVHPWM